MRSTFLCSLLLLCGCRAAPNPKQDEIASLIARLGDEGFATGHMFEDRGEELQILQRLAELGDPIPFGEMPHSVGGQDYFPDRTEGRHCWQLTEDLYLTHGLMRGTSRGSLHMYFLVLRGGSIAGPFRDRIVKELEGRLSDEAVVY